MASKRTRSSSKPAAQPVDAKTSGRDIRIDRLGLFKIVEREMSGLPKEIKKSMEIKGYKCVSGDVFEGVVAPCTETVIDPKQLFALVKSKRITMDDFFNAIRVHKETVEIFLSPRDIEKISNKVDGTPRLNVRIKGEPTIDLHKALVDLLNMTPTDEPATQTSPAEQPAAA